MPTISAASAAAAAEFPLEGRKHAQKPVVSLGQRAGEAPPPALTAFAEQRAGASDAYTFAPSPAAPPPPPPQHHVDTLKAAFGEFDRNGDGVLSMLEVTAALKRLQLSPPMSLLRQFAKADGNADGSLQFAEFCALVAELQRQSGVGAAGSGGASGAAGAAPSAAPSQASELLEAQRIFAMHDRDQSGYINTRELKRALNALNLDADTQQVTTAAHATAHPPTLPPPTLLTLPHLPSAGARDPLPV